MLKRAMEAHMKRLLVLGLSTVLAAPGFAAELSPNRYSFVPAEGGVLRLDAATGEVAFCTAVADAATCTPAGVETADAQESATDAGSRIAALEERIAALEMTRDPEALADEEAMDRVMLLTERMMRRFFGLVRELKRDMETDEL
jgi:hypothetical protein